MTCLAIKDLACAQRERLAFIEFRLWFFGEVSRKNVMDRFGVGTAAGTRDLMLYRDLAPENARYEGKVYRYLPTFKPRFQHQVHRVLSALTSGFGEGERSNEGAVIPHEVPARLNQPDLKVLAKVTRAIEGGLPLKLSYHSIKTGLVEREIVPHALVDSGLRWHVRAFDRSKGEFRDLVLTRMENLTEFQAGGALAAAHANERQSADAQWQQMLELNLMPHPACSHPTSIERDFGMMGGVLKLSTRAAMAGYVLRQWQVDCSPNASLRGAEYRLRLADLNVLEGVASAELAPGYC